MSWKCDTCEATFNVDDIPEKCPKCGIEDGTFSLIDEEKI